MIAGLFPCFRGVVLIKDSEESASKSSQKAISIIKPLGQGAFGTVLLAKDLENNFLALKMPRRPSFQESILHEHRLLRFLNEQRGKGSQNVIRQEGLCANSWLGLDATGLLLELGRDTLFQRIAEGESFSLTELKFVLKQIFLGLLFLKQNDVIHGDLKSDNILFFSGAVVKIADFSSAFFQADSGECTLYNQASPPEKLMEVIPYTPAIDMWGAGLVAIEMIARRFCFSWVSKEDLVFQHEAFLGTEYKKEFHGLSYIQAAELTGEGSSKINLLASKSLKEIVYLRFEKESGDGAFLLNRLLSRVFSLNPQKRIDPCGALEDLLFFEENSDCCLFRWLDPT